MLALKCTLTLVCVFAVCVPTFILSQKDGVVEKCSVVVCCGCVIGFVPSVIWTIWSLL